MTNVPFPYFPLVTEHEVGPWCDGVITVHVPEFDLFFAIDVYSGHQFAVVKKFTDPKVFDKLCSGTRVRFRATKKLPRVVAIEIVP